MAEPSATPKRATSSKRKAKEEERRPIAEVLPLLGIHPIPEGEVPVAAFVLIKALGPDGGTYWSFRTTEPFENEELLGALIVQTDLLRKRLVHEWDVD